MPEIEQTDSDTDVHLRVEWGMRLPEDRDADVIALSEEAARSDAARYADRGAVLVSRVVGPWLARSVAEDVTAEPVEAVEPVRHRQPGVLAQLATDTSALVSGLVARLPLVRSGDGAR